jgi:hypothetical protein
MADCATLGPTNRGVTKMSNSGDSPTNPGNPPHGERRTVPRYNLIATAELFEPNSGVRMNGRISEIGRKGCYLDVLNVLPMGTVIQVRISRDQGKFASSGRIVYAQEGMGMGVEFVNTPADQLQILDAWLAELAK